MIAEKVPPSGSPLGFPDSPGQDQTNPLINLPASIDNIISDLDAVIVIHLHLDHWDEEFKVIETDQPEIIVVNTGDNQF